jgi:hypothetical protein
MQPTALLSKLILVAIWSVYRSPRSIVSGVENGTASETRLRGHEILYR